MEINFVKQRKDAERNPLENTSYMKDAIGFWGNVCDVDSTINSVDVISDTGIKYQGIPVISKEWVNKDKDQEYTTGSRNLPPYGARVFVLTPTHTASGAFVLCSGYAKGDTKKQTLYATKDESGEDKKEKNTIEEAVLLGGWKVKKYYENGNLTISNDKDEIQLEVVNVDDTKNNVKKSISLSVFGHNVVIKKDEIKIADSFKNNITTTKDGITVKDSFENQIETTKDGLSIIDTKGVKIVTGTSGLEIYKNKDETEKQYIKLGNKISIKGQNGILEIS